MSRPVKRLNGEKSKGANGKREERKKKRRTFYRERETGN